MQGRIRSTVAGIAITLVVIVWIVSDPPPERVAEARSRALSDETELEVSTPTDRAASETPALASETRPEVAKPLAVAATPPRPTSWDQESAPGIVEVLVLLDREPAAGASVKLAHRPNDVADEVADAQTTDEHGLARFGPLSGRVAGTVEASLPPDVSANVRIDLPADAPSPRIVLHLGGGGIEGHVYALDGAPIANAQVQLEHHPAAKGRDWLREVRTAEDGSYRIGGLSAGVAQVYADAAKDSDGRSRDVVLADGEWKRVDFGSSQPPVRWTGRVVLASGAAATDLDFFQVTSSAHEQSLVRCNENGEFEALLPPGECVPSVWTLRGETVLESVKLAGASLARDLVVPGIELCGSISYTGTSPNPDEVLPRVQVWIADANGRKHLAGRAQNGKRYAFFALEPGDYVITTWTQKLLGAGDAGFQVHLDGARDHVEVDLTVTDP